MHQKTFTTSSPSPANSTIKRRKQKPKLRKIRKKKKRRNKKAQISTTSRFLTSRSTSFKMSTLTTEVTDEVPAITTTTITIEVWELILLAVMDLALSVINFLVTEDAVLMVTIFLAVEDVVLIVAIHHTDQDAVASSNALPHPTKIKKDHRTIGMKTSSSRPVKEASFLLSHSSS